MKVCCSSDPQRVYVLVESAYHDNATIIGVFLTREDAVEAVKDYLQRELDVKLQYLNELVKKGTMTSEVVLLATADDKMKIVRVAESLLQGLNDIEYDYSRNFSILEFNVGVSDPQPDSGRYRLELD